MSSKRQDPDFAPRESKCQAFLRGIYNSQEGTFCGRTGASWAKIGTFYVIYYICLAAFFCGMLSVLVYGMMSPHMPYLTGSNSLLADGPGVAIHPKFKSEVTKDVESTLIHVDSREGSHLFQRYEKEAEEFLKVYKDDALKPNQMSCNVKTHTRPETGVDKVCKFPLSELDVCANPVEHLKKSKNPCVYLTANKIYGWLPDLVDNATTPMVKCSGQNPADNENLGTPEYYPSVMYGGHKYGAISHAFFPFLAQKNYSTPVVAVTFPNAIRNVLLLLKCSIVGISSTAGDTAFELLID